MIHEILKEAVDRKVSDIFLVPGRPVSFYKNGVIVKQDSESLTPDEVEEDIKEIYDIAERC